MENLKTECCERNQNSEMLELDIRNCRLVNLVFLKEIQ